MKQRLLSLLCVPAAALLIAAANGAWVEKVPAADHAMANPMAGQPDAISAGLTLFQNNCAQCHGADGNGRGRRPPVHSVRIAGTTDGDLFWLLRNGQPFRGMPSWAKLPEDQRWQLIAWLRTIQPQPAPPAENGGKR